MKHYRDNAEHYRASWPLSKKPSLPERTVSIPRPSLRYRAFSYFTPEETKVIILGQDPYPTDYKANGLAFGISDTWVGDRHNSSFGNIIHEVMRSTNFATDTIAPEKFIEWATLEGWAEQGVLLTNTRLTVEPGKPMSHAGLGWEWVVMGCLVEAITRGHPTLVAFGAEARKFFEKALKLSGQNADTWKVAGRFQCYSHPCKYSATRGSKHAEAFLGSNCFAKINANLTQRGRDPINWLKVTT